MKILLVIFSIYDTLENINDDGFNEMLDKIKLIARENKDNTIMVSFFDNTENREILLYYLRNIITNYRNENIILGRQFLGNAYYDNIINGGAILYDNNEKKENKVFEYVDELSKKNIIDLYYIDGKVNLDYINTLFSKFNKNVNVNIINEKDNNINKKLIKY